MRPVIALALAGIAALCASQASAVMCYRLIDRNDNVVYQDIFPPVDLSDQGAAERDALRARGEHMISMETDRCPRLELVAGPGVGLGINLEEMGDELNALGKPAAPAPSSPPVKRSGSPKPPAKSEPAKASAKPAAPAQ